MTRLPAAPAVAGLDDLVAAAPGATAAPLFTTGLRVLVTALRTEARLNPAGVTEATGALRAAQRVQARASTWATRPEGRAASSTAGAVDRPIVITGMHRTGTTHLQRLLAALPGVRAPALWELVHPVPEPGEDTGALLDEVRGYVRAYDRAAPVLRGIHPLDAEGPEECHRLLGATFCSGIYELRYRVPTYAAWLETIDMREPYRFHRLLLRALLSRGGAGRVVLKCPLHVRHLDALRATYPDALVVHLHRAPHETIASAAHLVSTIRATRSDQIDRREIGAYWLRHTERMAVRAAEATAGRTVHVRFPDLVERPAEVVARVCERAGLSPHRRSAALFPTVPFRPARSATLADFALSRDEVDRRLAAYRDQFRV
jgi:hypothetical protein